MTQHWLSPISSSGQYLTMQQLRSDKWDTKYPTCEEGHAFTAGTLAELAKLTNQPNLEKTVARYKRFCRHQER